MSAAIRHTLHRASSVATAARAASCLCASASAVSRATAGISLRPIACAFSRSAHTHTHTDAAAATQVHSSAHPAAGPVASHASTPTGESASTASRDTTHFGFQTVETERKEALVGEVFRRVADSYDLMNDLMSGAMHRVWKDAFISRASPIVSSRDEACVCLDVAGGTGDIAFRIVDAIRHSLVEPRVRPRVIVCDINDAMLGVGRERARALGYMRTDEEVRRMASSMLEPQMTFMQGNAEVLAGIPDNSVDLYTIAFGIRNVTHVDEALRQAYRVLKPGGRFMCLEFSQVTNPLIRSFYDLYSFNVIPAMGQAVANDRASYQYLVESIRKFPDQERFAEMIRDAGFSNVTYENFTFGVCAVHSGFKWRHG